MKNVTFYIPENFDPLVILAEEKRIDVKRDLHYSMFYVLDLMYRYPKTAKGRTIFEQTGGVPINVETLREVLGKRKADRALKKLLDTGFIIKKRKAIAYFNLSTVYGFSDPVYKWVSVEVAEPTKSWKKAEADEEGSQTSLDHVEKWLKPEFLTPDFLAADFYLQFLYNDLFFKIKALKKPYYGEKLIEYKERLLSYLNYRMSEIAGSLKDFDKSIQEFSRSDRNGRMNTFLSNSFKPVRNLVKIDGKDLVEIDISACQPLMLFWLFELALKPQKLNMFPISATHLKPHLHTHTHPYPQLTPYVGHFFQ